MSHVLIIATISGMAIGLTFVVALVVMLLALMLDSECLESSIPFSMGVVIVGLCIWTSFYVCGLL